MSQESIAEQVCDLLRPIEHRPWHSVTVEMAMTVWNVRGEGAARAYIANVLEHDPVSA